MPVSCGFVDEDFRNSGFQEFRIRGAEGLEGLEFFQRKNISCPFADELFVSISWLFVDEDFRNSGLEV